MSAFFPVVPQVAGVPPVIRAQNTIVPIIVAVQSDLASLASLFSGPQWGIFDGDGNPAIVGDSVLAMEFAREWNNATYPIEQGGFQSYNKVEVPYDVRFTFTKGGATSDRAQFLVDVDSACHSLDTTFSAVTPEAGYPSVNPYHYDYRREAKNGATLLKVQVYCKKVRTSATTTFGNPADPATNDPVSGGNVQTGNVAAGSPLAAQLDANPNSTVVSTTGNTTTTFGPEFVAPPGTFH